MDERLLGRARRFRTAAHARAARAARRTLAFGFHTIVLPLLGEGEDEAARAVACRLAAERGARLLLVAPLFVDLELPMNAHFSDEERSLADRLEREQRLVESYAITAKARIVRVRPGDLGRAIAHVADEERASLVVVGAEALSARGFRRVFSRDVESLMRNAPCRVLLLAGEPRGVPATHPRAA
jgi:nucleotide-binding universal stress UspA family protein